MVYPALLMTMDRVQASLQDGRQFSDRQLGGAVADVENAAPVWCAERCSQGGREGVPDRGPDRLCGQFGSRRQMQLAGSLQRGAAVGEDDGVVRQPGLDDRPDGALGEGLAAVEVVPVFARRKWSKSPSAKVWWRSAPRARAALDGIPVIWTTGTFSVQLPATALMAESSPTP